MWTNDVFIGRLFVRTWIFLLLSLWNDAAMMPYSPLHAAASFSLNSAHADPVHVNTHCISIWFHRAFKLHINHLSQSGFLSHFQSKSNINFTLENEGNSIK